jgi:spore coat polysaccharide biosynthesis protein SpsF
MTSTRLPGKVLMPCLGKPMLDLLVERVRRSEYIDEIVVATTVNPPDDAIRDAAARLGIGCFRGDEDDVVGRVTGAMEASGAGIVVQLTADCPLLDPEVIDQLLRVHAANSFDYVSNTLVRSYPRGLDVQVASLAILRESLRLAEDGPQHEHLFLSVYERPERFRLFSLMAPAELCRPDLRWTLDTPEDYAFICRAYEALYPANPRFTSADLIRLCRERPEIPALNQDIQQKKARP